ncbi:MAG: lysX [Propionibacteriaceae bacterium]|nr:lysX [Propionibacteriaceae bacterium]
MAVDLNTSAERTPADKAEAGAEKPVRTRLLRDDRWPDWLATAMFAFAALVVVATFIPPLRRYFLRWHDVISMLTIPIVPNLVYAALLIAMGIALRRRLRTAWWLLIIWWIILPQLGRIYSITTGGPRLQIVGLVIMSVVLVIVWRARSQFLAHGVMRNLIAAIICFLVGLLVILVLGTWLVNTFGTAPDLSTATLHVVDKLLGEVGLTRPDEVTSPLWVTILLDLLGAATILTSTYLLFKPPPETKTLSAVDEARVRTLLRTFGDSDSLGYFATRRDKSIVWNTGEPATAQAGVSYRVIGSVSLASGNPVGDPEHWGSAIERWRAKARANGWSLAVMGAGELGAAAYTEAGLTAFEIGDEAILDMRSFSLNGPGMKSVRQSVSRLQRRGYTTNVVRHGDLDPAQFDALSSSAARWRGDGGDERGFSMALGRLGDPLDSQCVLVEAHDVDGTLHGFLSFVPWGRNGLSLDLMRRDPTADNGLVELMVASLADRAAAFSVGRVSLNFAMFREAFERGAQIGAGPIARLWRQALLVASRNWQLESLYRSNAKYQPEWQPRYICFEYTSDLPRVGTAAGSAEGFLTRPSLATLHRHGKEPAAGALERAGEAYAAEVTAQIPEEPDAVAEAMSLEGLPEQVRVRREKLMRLREQGINPFPVTFPRSHTLAQVRAEAGELPPDTRTGRQVSVAGRVILSRDGGKLCFATLRDGSGDLQIMIALDAVGPEVLRRWRHDVDLGDHVGVIGEVITTKRGELTVRAESYEITAKSIRPLPDKHKGLTDPEARVRARYVDLIVRPEAREIAYVRAAVVRSVRDSLQNRGFTEVETPMPGPLRPTSTPMTSIFTCGLLPSCISSA